MIKKFRIYDKNEYLYSDKCLDFWTKEKELVEVMNRPFSVNLLEQYTGYEDSQNKEIYENDYLQVAINGVLQNGYYLVEDIRDLAYQLNREDSYLRFAQVRVIGNVHNLNVKPNELFIPQDKLGK